MITKDKVFNLLVQGKPFTASTQYEKELVIRFFDLKLAREFGWTQSDILTKTTQDFYDDAVLVIQKEAFFRNKKPEKTPPR